MQVMIQHPQLWLFTTVADNVLYLSSGTWSLMGTELLKARCDEKSRYVILPMKVDTIIDLDI